MSKKEGKQRISRKEQRRQQVKRQKRMQALRFWIPVGIVAVGMVVLLLTNLTEGEVEGAVFVDSAVPNQHDENIEYGFGGLPPTGGVHRPTWQNCGIYDEPVAAEYAVHSLEHGAVWVTYQSDLPAGDVATLQDLMRGQDYIILSPYPDQDVKLVLTAWDVQLQLDSVTDERIEQFIKKYRQRRGPEPSASCSGGIGNPIG